jgi:hypothetical protein
MTNSTTSRIIVLSPTSPPQQLRNAMASRQPNIQGRTLGFLSSIWDPNSMASPVYCWDEEAPQNHRTRTRPNCLVVSLWAPHSGDGQAAWPKSLKHF